MSSAGVVAYRGKGNVYVNLTNRCTCACVFCLRSFTDQVYGYSLRLEQEPSAPEVRRAIERELAAEPVREVVFCGLGEPTLRLPEVLAITEWLSARPIRSRLNTNGLGQLANPSVAVVDQLVAAGLSAISISLNAADPVAYQRTCRPTYDHAFPAVLAFARTCVAAGLPTQLTVVDYPGVNVSACAGIATGLRADFCVRARATPRITATESGSAGARACR